MPSCTAEIRHPSFLRRCGVVIDIHQEIALGRAEEAIVEVRRADGFAGDAHHRIIAGGKGHRHRSQHAHAQAGRAVALLDAVAILGGAGEHGRAFAVAIGGADHVEGDFHVLVAGGLEALVAIQSVVGGLADDVALAQQGAAGGFADGFFTAGEAAREGAGIVEFLLMIEGGLAGGAGGQAQRGGSDDEKRDRKTRARHAADLQQQ